MEFYITVFFLLVFCHFLADYPLQGQWLAETKSRHHSLGSKNYLWLHSLVAHSFIHAGFVGLITNNIFLALFELVAHFIIDFLKCEGLINLHQDQALHITCKLAWLVMLILFFGG